MAAWPHGSNLHSSISGKAMMKTNPDLRAPWVGCVLIAAAFVPGCANEVPAASEEPEVEDTTEAITQAEYDCERTKRECLAAADCDADLREACESAFHACKDPVRAEQKQVRETCRAQRETCDAAAADDAARHACHVAEHECKLPVDPPEAVCHIDALNCIWAARSAAPDATPPMKSEAEQACRETERACTAADPTVPDTQSMFACERTKRECLIAANCDADMREACTGAFHACAEPIRAEKKRVHELCHAEREACDAAATDEAGRQACHIAEHRCKLPVDPPEAVCRIDAEECRWAAKGAPDMTDPMNPRPDPSAAELACRETERACKESLRMRPEDLPKPPHCPPAPRACTPEASP